MLCVPASGYDFLNFEQVYDLNLQPARSSDLANVGPDIIGIGYGVVADAGKRVKSSVDKEESEVHAKAEKFLLETKSKQSCGSKINAAKLYNAGMAVISPSAATGGRSTGFSYVFNASRAVFQGSAQNVTVRDVTHKNKEIGSPKKCKIAGAVETTKDGSTSAESSAPAIKTAVVESSAESACISSSDIGQSDVSTISDRTKSQRSNTEPDKLVVSESTISESHNSGSQQKSSSNKRLTSWKSEKKRTNVNVTDVQCSTSAPSLDIHSKDRNENVSDSKTSFRKCQVQTLQNSSTGPLTQHSYVTKAQQSLSKNAISEQSFEDKTSSRHQINCDKTKLNERNSKESSKVDANGSLNKSKPEKGVEERKGKTVENKSLSTKKLMEEKLKFNTKVIQQKDFGQNETKNITEDGKKHQTKLIMQRCSNKITSEKFSSVSISPCMNMKRKQNTVSKSTDEFQVEDQQKNKHATSEKPNMPSRSDTTSKIQSEKSQRDCIVNKTVEKHKTNVIPTVNSQRGESSDKTISECQKNVKDSVSEISEKTEKNSLKSKINDPLAKKSVKERGISPNRISAVKRSSDLKAANIISHVSPSETLVEKVKKKLEDEIESPKQFSTSQKDGLHQSLTNTQVKSTPKADNAEAVRKFVCSQKQIIKTSEKGLIEEPQIDDFKKSEKLTLTTAAKSFGEVLVKKSKVMDTKSDTADKTTAPVKGAIKRLADKFSTKREEALTDEKVSKDDEKALSATVDAISWESNAQSYESKSSGKPESSKINVEKSEKPVVNWQKDLPTKVVVGDKSQQDLKDKCDEQQTEKLQEGNHSDTSVITDTLQLKQKTKTDKVRTEKVKPQKSSSSVDSRLDKGMEISKSNKAHELNKTLASKDAVEHPSEKTVVKSQGSNKEKSSSVNEASVESNNLKSFSETKISTKECHREILENDTKKITTVTPDDRGEASRTDKTINKSITSVDKQGTDIAIHCSDASETLENNEPKYQKGKEKAAVCSGKNTVSKLSTQECKKQSAPTKTSKSSDNSLTAPNCNTNVSMKSKLEVSKTREGVNGATSQLEGTGKLFGKSDGATNGDACKSIENSFKDSLSKSQSYTTQADNIKVSDTPTPVADGKQNICEVKSPSSASDDFKGPEIIGERMPPIRPVTDIVDPKNEIAVDNKKSLINTYQEESIKCRRYAKENRPCSYPTTERREFPGLQQGRSSSQQSLDYYARDCTLSAIDYAKSRFQNVQQAPRCDEVVKPRPKSTQMVNEFKSLWENYEQKETALRVPHPIARKLHMRQKISSLTSEGQCDADFPIRPFLTKGSVAERVLLFECCPERALDRSSGKSKSLLYNTWKSAGLHHKTRFWEVIGEKDRPPRSFYIQREKDNLELSKATAYCRFSKFSNLHDIPLFHYPKGRPLTQTEIERQLKEIKAAFSTFTDEKVTKEEFGVITKACGLPIYWKLPLFLSAAGENKPFLKCDVFLQYWRRIISVFHDEASQFVAVLTKCGRDYLVPDDFIPMIQDIIDTHPGLTFLKEATEFHSRYVHTVISRIYYCVNKSWSGKITVAELRKSNFLQIVSLLEKEDDINQITDYFSYEHFYVIYCKFWELDKDHDLFIDKNDLRRHNDGAISSRMIDRIFSGAVTRSSMQKDGKMSYTDFVWFLFSEEDKRHPRSIEYWFRCMDLDGDGYLSMYEMEYFYEEQLQRMEALNIETLPFKDCLCQMLDMIRPKIPGLISLADLKKCKMTPLFFDTFFNLEKYLDHEQRDPFASQREQETDTSDMSDWDRYAAEEYELLVAEEGGSDHSDDLIYDDYTQEDDELLSSSPKIDGSNIISRRGNSVEDDNDDYADTDLTYY